MKHISVMTDRELYEAIIANIKKSFRIENSDEEYEQAKDEAEKLKEEIIGRGEHCLAGYSLFLFGKEPD